MKRSKSLKKLKAVARLHALVSGGLMALYVGLSLIYSPDFLLSDIRDKFHALAADTITVTARVLGSPVKPVVMATPVCNTGSGTLSVSLDWPDDENSFTFDISRDGLPLTTGLVASSYSDTSVSVGTTYTYEVTARGPMDPGSAVSDPVVAATPSECVIAFTPTLSIDSFGGRSVSGYSGIPAVSDRKPQLSGTTNILNANVSFLINGSTVISAVTTANANGYFTWEPPIDLSRGTHTVFVTATDPTDSSITVSSSLVFRITKQNEDGGGKTSVVTSVSPSTAKPGTEPEPEQQTGEPIPGMPFDMALSLASSEVYQGRALPFSVTFSHVAEEFRGSAAIARYTVLDADGRERFSFFENIAIDEGKTIFGEVAIPPYFREGAYRLKAEILIDRFNVSHERAFSVIPLPLLSPGGGFVVLYSEFLSRLGTFALLLLLLLLLWLFVFSREYMLYLRAIRHITERHLARAGFLGNRSRPSY